MRFKQRKKLADKYREWVKQPIDNNQTMILDCAESVIAFLDINGYLYEAEPRWIPCSERLPIQSGFYLTTINWYGTLSRSVKYFNGKDFFKANFETGDIIAWMPLPEPYKEEN